MPSGSGDDLCTHPSGTIHPFALYVVPGDPLRNTPEKAEVYYQKVWDLLSSVGLPLWHIGPETSEADARAALKLVGKT